MATVQSKIEVEANSVEEKKGVKNDDAENKNLEKVLFLDIDRVMNGSILRKIELRD